MTAPLGFTIYRGPSLIDGAPIVVIALTGRASLNKKTGSMVQTYILNDNGKRPAENAATGADRSICGDCKQRPAMRGACYVVLNQGPSVVWRGYQAGKYPAASAYNIAPLITGRMVRLGAYGDPAAVPARIWTDLLKYAKGHTGYTHQWRNNALGAAQLEALRDLCMASCDTPQERVIARIGQWRTFTIRLASEPLAKKESACPAAQEAGRKLTCEQCLACNGASSGRHGSIAIVVHGRKSSVNRYAELRRIT